MRIWPGLSGYLEMKQLQTLRQHRRDLDSWQKSFAEGPGCQLETVKSVHSKN
jgi:hypothetical protein